MKKLLLAIALITLASTSHAWQNKTTYQKNYMGGYDIKQGIRTTGKVTPTYNGGYKIKRYGNGGFNNKTRQCNKNYTGNIVCKDSY